MLSYRKLAMRVLGRPLHTGGGINSPRPASQRAAAFILTAALLTGAAFPAFAGTYYIEDGDIVISAGTETGTNKVEQGGKETVDNDRNTIITNQNKDKASSNTVTIEANGENDKVEVKLEDVNIDASSRSEAAVSVTGKGDTTIELDGDNELKSGADHAGLEHNKTDTSGELTIQDKDKNGSLKAAGGFQGAGIGSAGSNDAQVKITGGEITATGEDWGAGIGSGLSNTGTGGTAYVEITGGEINATGGSYGAGIGSAGSNDAQVKITGGNITATGGNWGAGIGGGYSHDSDVTISGNAKIENVTGGYCAAGIGGGYGHDGDVTISGNAKIENVTGGYGAAGIGGGAFDSFYGKIGNGNVVIKDNAEIDHVQGGYGAAGIGGGIFGLGNVTIEGNTRVSAAGGAGGAGIGGGAGAENNSDNKGNQITIKSNENGNPTVKAFGGGTNEGKRIFIGGAGIGAGCESDADADITLEGKVTITATAGKDNVAIGDMNGEQVFTGLDGSITRYDSEGNDTTLPTDPGYPVPADTSSSGGGSADASVQESVFPGLVVTDKDGQRISYTSIRDNNVLSLRVGRFTASLRASLATLRQLRAEGIDTITFQTILCSTTLSVDELLAMGGEDTEVVLTHHIRSSTLTVGGKAV